MQITYEKGLTNVFVIWNYKIELSYHFPFDVYYLDYVIILHMYVIILKSILS